MSYHTSVSSGLVSKQAPEVGALLRMAWEELIEELFTKLAAAGFDDLRPVHRPIIRDLLVEGLRPTELAARLGLSKQAVNDILRELEAKGYILLEPDPEDGRAKRIVVSDRGRRLTATAARLSRTVGHRWADRVGERRYEVFESVLRDIADPGESREAERDVPTVRRGRP